MGLIGASPGVLPPNNPPEWTSTPNPTGVVGTGFTYALANNTFDQESDTLTYTLNAGSTAWPSGWSMDSAGLITVTSGAAEATTTGMIVDVKDPTSSLIASPSFSAVINAVSSALGYPRIAGLVNGGFATGDHDLDDLDRYSNANWFTMNFTSSTNHPRIIPGTGGLNDQEILDRMRGNNPGMILTNWVNAIQTLDGPGTAPGPYVQDLIDEMEANTGPVNTDWYAYRTDKITGTHNGSNNASVLSDSGGGWTTNEHVGKAIFNLTDGSKGGVTSNTSTTVTAVLTNGAGNDWDSSDSYMIISYGGGDWQDNLFLNWSSFVTVDGSGDKLAANVAKNRYNDNYQNADWDGYLVDGQRTEAFSPAQQIDFDQDGDTDESVKETTGATLYKTYHSDFVSEMNTLIGGSDHTTGGNNGGTWIPAGDDVSPLPEYNGMNQGGLWEGAMGKAFSPDIWGAGNVNVWKNNIVKFWIEYCTMDDQWGSGFVKAIPAALSTKAFAPFTLMNCEFPPTAYDRLRYYICTCLLGDGYFLGQPDIGNGWSDWFTFDEYFNGSANTYNWMGQPVDGMIDASAVSAWSNGVYAREFDNGAIFVNPDGNGNQTIDPTNFKGGLWKRIDGTQDDTTNDGTDITGSFVLNDRDGLVVVRQ